MTARHDKLVEQACRRLEAPGPAPNLATLAAQAQMSPWHFQRLFTAAIGVSPKRYAMAQRQRRLQAALGAAPSVTDAIFDAGYPASSAAYRDLNGHGLKPAQLRRGGAGEIIHYAYATSTLGQLVVAASQRGLCLVEFASTSAAPALLQARFAHAQIVAAPRQMRATIKTVVALIDAPGAAATLPLDIRGTAFQTRVWRALTRIPPGQTLSYGELAASLGMPGSSRAVARACGANSLAVVVPCHRVIGGDGQLRGYRWGLARKRKLLEREATTKP